MAMFNSYVKLPEGNNGWIRSGWSGSMAINNTLASTPHMAESSLAISPRLFFSAAKTGLFSWPHRTSVSAEACDLQFGNSPNALEILQLICGIFGICGFPPHSPAPVQTADTHCEPALVPLVHPQDGRLGWRKADKWISSLQHATNSVCCSVRYFCSNSQLSKR